MFFARAGLAGPLTRSVARLPRALATLVLALTVAALAAGPADAQLDEGGGLDEVDRVVEILPLDGLLDPPSVAAIRDVVTGADERDAELVVVQIDSPGGVSVDVEDLARRVRASRVPVAVFVGPRNATANAGGAAGALWLAADVRAVASDAAVGPLSPLDLGSDPDDARAAALAADLAPGASSAVVTGRVEADRLAEAGVADLVADGLEPLLVELDGRVVETADGPRELRIRRDEVGVRFHSLGLVRRLLHAATTPVFIYLLFTVGLALLAFEVFQPGFGVAGVAGVVAAVIGVFGLTVLPAAWWAVALIVAGLAVLALDTALAGFGPATFAGTAAFGVGSWRLYEAPMLELPGWIVVAATATVFVFFVFVLTAILRAQAGPEGLAVEQLVGKRGIVRSVLNPEGHVYIDQALWRARWTGEGRRARVGTPVRVHGVDGPTLLVEGVAADNIGTKRDETGSASAAGVSAASTEPPPDGVR